MDMLYKTADEWGWTTTVEHESGEDDCDIPIIAIKQWDENEERFINLYREEAIAAAKAILRHYGEE